MTDSLKFKEGDIVKLKSGGPDMVIYHVPEKKDSSKQYGCKWFAGKKLESGVFSEESISKVENQK